MQNLSDISVIRSVLEKHGFNFSKALGQNFLINPSVCPRMAEYSLADENGFLIVAHVLHSIFSRADTGRASLHFADPAVPRAQ